MLLCFGSVLDHRCRLIVVKTKKWHMSCRRVCHWCFPTFWRLLCDLLLTRLMATWNLLVLYSEERGKSYIYIYLPRTTWLFEVRFVPLYKLQKLLFVPPSASSSLSYLHTVYPKSFSTPFTENRIIAKTFPNLRVSMTSYGKFYKEFFQMRYFQVVKNTYCLGFSTFLICNQLPLNFFWWPSLAKSENVFFNLFQNRVILNTTKKTSCRALYMYLFV